MSEFIQLSPGERALGNGLNQSLAKKEDKKAPRFLKPRIRGPVCLAMTDFVLLEQAVFIDPNDLLSGKVRVSAKIPSHQ